MIKKAPPLVKQQGRLLNMGQQMGQQKKTTPYFEPFFTTFVLFEFFQIL